MDNSSYDLVYILKASDHNPDLKYSLRSIEKYCTFRKIWMVGYVPTWVKNVNGITVRQTSTKWNNSTENVIAACENDNISENFILMNDDFFALKPIKDWKESCNKVRGTLMGYYKLAMATMPKSLYRSTFLPTHTFLRSLGYNTFNYELHIPTIINRQKFLEMLEMEEIKKFRQDNEIFFKRSIYNNIYQEDTPVVSEDVKLMPNIDMSYRDLNHEWLSVRDGCVNNPRFKYLNNYLNTEFKLKSKYER